VLTSDFSYIRVTVINPGGTPMASDCLVRTIASDTEQLPMLFGAG
jgi:hypothetical protein